MNFKTKPFKLTILFVISLLILGFIFFLAIDRKKQCMKKQGEGNTITQRTAINNTSTTKRYCLTLNLKNDPELIAEYKKVHEDVWPEITAGFVEVGIVDMEIYLLENKLFMILETKKDFDIIKDFERMGKLPRQKEWENLVSKFQDTEDPESIDKWKVMERIYKFSQKDISK